MPLAILYVKGMIASVRNDGIAMTISLKSIWRIDCAISTPTIISAAAVAEPGIRAATGARNRASRKHTPVVTAVRPVRPPSATPAALST
ncbi:hypothetical protein D3C73_1356530 [compost metagenome]